jgi:hypothetical protein
MAFNASSKNLWHLMLNCCESRVAVSVPRVKKEKWNRPRVLHIIDSHKYYRYQECKQEIHLVIVGSIIYASLVVCN